MQSSRNPRHTLLVPALALSLSLATPLAAGAQSDSVATDGVGVARVSLIDGNVGLQRGDSSESLAAAINAPVLGGDYVTTGGRSRTEIQFDGSSQLRLGSDSQLRFTHLDTNNRTVQLAQGTLELRLLRSADGANEIDTPSVSIKPQGRGAYRVSVTPDGQTLVTVRSGDAEIDTPQGAQDVQPGSTFIAQGAASDPSIQTVASIASDDFDRFNTDRDRLHERALADSAFVNTDIGGIDDLNDNGRWVADGSYGHVWVPAAVGPDWAPYRDGRWVWEDGYGWTWVSAERWGWAPYHYGSWYHSPNYGWCWYPPQPHIFAPWRPALVAFIGFGAGAGLSLGFGGESFGNVGWVPLAPYEPYHPWWGNRYGYGGGNTTIVNNVTNITNVTNVTNVNVYRNVRYNAVSSVTSQRFLQGNFAANRAVSTADLRQAHVFRSALPIVPSASNLRFTTSGKAPVAMRSTLVERSFAGNADVVRRTTFAAQRVALAAATHTLMAPLQATQTRLTPPVPLGKPLDARANASPTLTAPAPAQAGTARRYAPPDPSIGRTDPWARFKTSRAGESGPARTARPAPEVTRPNAVAPAATHDDYARTLRPQASAAARESSRPPSTHESGVPAQHEPATNTYRGATEPGRPVYVPHTNQPTGGAATDRHDAPRAAERHDAPHAVESHAGRPPGHERRR